jgi:hypothetical protein
VCLPVRFSATLAPRWMSDKLLSENDELRRFRAEAEALLAGSDQP